MLAVRLVEPEAAVAFVVVVGGGVGRRVVVAGLEVVVFGPAAQPSCDSFVVVGPRQGSGGL